MPSNAASMIKLFLGTFVSALLLFVGVGTLLLMFVPALYTLVVEYDDYQPLLPLAEARGEEFLDIDDIPPKQLYPPLTDPSVPTETPPTGTVGWIRIPAIEVAVPIAASPTMDDRDVLATLDRGAALYPNGIKPGHLGNAFISAHSTGEPWRGRYRFAFLRINELETGHVIHVDYNNTRYTYRVVAKETVKPDPDFRVISNRPKPTLTLMACWPLWTSSQRMLITSELTNITQLTERL